MSSTPSRSPLLPPYAAPAELSDQPVATAAAEAASSAKLPFVPPTWSAPTAVVPSARDASEPELPWIDAFGEDGADDVHDDGDASNSVAPIVMLGEHVVVGSHVHIGVDADEPFASDADDVSPPAQLSQDDTSPLTAFTDDEPSPLTAFTDDEPSAATAFTDDEPSPLTAFTDDEPSAATESDADDAWAIENVGASISDLVGDLATGAPAASSASAKPHGPWTDDEPWMDIMPALPNSGSGDPALDTSWARAFAEPPAPLVPPPLPAGDAQAAAASLENIARRLRSGDLSVPGFQAESGDAAALAAALASMLGARE